MNKSTDWKAKYQGAIADLEAQESEWKSLEDILRRAIGRLCIASRGHDSRLDEQLKLIQNLSRKKKNQTLSEALENLADIIASLDDASHAPVETQSTDTAPVLRELLKNLKFSTGQKAELESVSGDLLKAITDNQGEEKIYRQLGRLSALINKNFNGDEPDSHGPEIIFQLIGLLNLDEAGREQIDQLIPVDKSITDRELSNLAEIINSQINTNGQQGNYISVAISSLLEKLSKVRCAPSSIGKIQARINDGVVDDQWQGILDEIATSISQILNKLVQEKQELENLIVKISEQISALTKYINENHEDHLSDHKETLSLQKFMQEGVAEIEGNVNAAQDIGRLKSEVATNIHLIREGVEKFVARVNSRHEAVEIRNEKLTRQVSTMEKETSHLQKKLKESSQKLLHDSLTGVGSRLAYDEQIVQELARGNRYGSSFSYAILDIDHFKKINDKYGHIAGDKALKIIAQLMMQQIRKSDHIFRIGGEEFVLLITNTELSNAETLVLKIRKAVAESGFHYKQEQIKLTLSAGITETQNGDEAQTIYERADSALYRAKKSGRNCQFVA